MAKHSNHQIADYQNVVDESTILLDVREPNEVVSGMLPGALNMPLGELKSRFAELDGSKRVVVYCRSGKRSERAARLLSSRGLDDVVNLEGGLLTLVAARRSQR